MRFFCTAIVLSGAFHLMSGVAPLRAQAMAERVAPVTAPADTKSPCTLPWFTGELTLGAGGHTERTSRGYFENGALSYARFGLAVRLGSAGRVRPYLQFEHSLKVRGDRSLLCSPAPDGGCYRGFPETDGPGAGLGLRAAMTRRLTLGAGAGLTTAAQDGRYVEGELAFRLIGPVTALAHLRQLQLSNRPGERVWFRPLTVGVRLQ